MPLSPLLTTLTPSLQSSQSCLFPKRQVCLNVTIYGRLFSLPAPHSFPSSHIPWIFRAKVQKRKEHSYMNSVNTPCFCLVLKDQAALKYDQGNSTPRILSHEEVPQGSSQQYHHTYHICCWSVFRFSHVSSLLGWKLPGVRAPCL